MPILQLIAAIYFLEFILPDQKLIKRGKMTSEIKKNSTNIQLTQNNIF